MTQVWTAKRPIPVGISDMSPAGWLYVVLERARRSIG